jgi:HSP20 family molecular chaperone IbpA
LTGQTLPPGILADKVEAKYHNGVLKVHVPKSEAHARRSSGGPIAVLRAIV